VTESEFNDIIDNIFLSIEEQLDELETDMDYEINAGILTIIMTNKSQLIINRQRSHFQLWLAAKSGGYHFNCIKDEKGGQIEWLDTKTGKTFNEVFNQCLFEQSGEKFSLSV